MLEVRLLDNSVQMFQKLQWLPSDRIIREKTLYMMFKTLNKECLDYSTNYITQVKKIIIAIALNLSIIFSLYRNVGQTLVFEDSMRVRLIYGTVWNTILWTWQMKGTLQNIYSWKSIQIANILFLLQGRFKALFGKIFNIHSFVPNSYFQVFSTFYLLNFSFWRWWGFIPQIVWTGGWN